LYFPSSITNLVLGKSLSRWRRYLCGCPRTSRKPCSRWWSWLWQWHFVCL